MLPIPRRGALLRLRNLFNTLFPPAAMPPRQLDIDAVVLRAFGGP
ncbi:hypothetical protein [Roseomonas chloroacetimidivorans]|jgi:hypothetical protein